MAPGRWLATLVVMACAGAAAAPLLAQGFPNKPVRIIVPFTPGSASDVVGRSVAQTLSEVWSQPVLVENRAGAGGTIGAMQVVKSAPDGYTLLVNTRALAAGPARPMHMSVAEFTKYMAHQGEESHRIIKAAGIKPQ